MSSRDLDCGVAQLLCDSSLSELNTLKSIWMCVWLRSCRSAVTHTAAPVLAVSAEEHVWETYELIPAGLAEISL